MSKNISTTTRTAKPHVLRVMDVESPTVAELRNAAARGQRITVEDATRISRSESEVTGDNPITGGAVVSLERLADANSHNLPATAHGLLMRQMEPRQSQGSLPVKSPRMMPEGLSLQQYSSPH